MRRILLSSLSILLLSSPLGAQIIRGAAQRDPTAWTSFAVGLLDIADVEDDDTRSVWSFGQGLRYRASLEKALSGQSGLGVVATFSQIPLTYSRATILGTGACPDACDATANIWSVSGGFHAGGGLGLHQVIQVGIGATMWGNFREKDGGAALPPAKMNVDLSFDLGYGIGYTLSPRAQASLVQEFGFIVHPGNGSGSSSSTVQNRVMRLGIRYGLGTKKAGVR